MTSELEEQPGDLWSGVKLTYWSLEAIVSTLVFTLGEREKTWMVLYREIT